MHILLRARLQELGVQDPHLQQQCLSLDMLISVVLMRDRRALRLHVTNCQLTANTLMQDNRAFRLHVTCCQLMARTLLMVTKRTWIPASVGSRQISPL